MNIVIKVDNAKVRQMIEAYTELHCKPDVVKFVQDGAGNWITSVENIDNIRFNSKAGTNQLKTFLVANQEASDNSESIVELIVKYGVEVEYVPLPEIDEGLK